MDKKKYTYQTQHFTEGGFRIKITLCIESSYYIAVVENSESHIISTWTGNGNYKQLPPDYAILELRKFFRDHDLLVQAN